ncbi:hypothetical protein NDU88_010060 [Pleurodeles waltl]|uniref:Uncharacterized protein n=1 Tax=Pleurodeles waltl TaxID=8319 RepID=A0AAV7S073_PLEWA|nr:hypothetical protein NDU88_010060 [Pleurodeles waltl]
MNTSGSDALFIAPAAPVLHHYRLACRRVGVPTWTIGLSICGESFFSFLSPERAIWIEHFRVRRSFYSSGSTRSAPLRACMSEGRCSDLDHRLIK